MKTAALPSKELIYFMIQTSSGIKDKIRTLDECSNA
jgi:hypothetical protein